MQLGRSYLYVSVLRPYLALCFLPPAQPWAENCGYVSSQNVFFFVHFTTRNKSWRCQLRLASLGARVSSPLSCPSTPWIVLALDPKISSRAVILQQGCADRQRHRRPEVCGGWPTEWSYPRHPTLGTPPLHTNSPQKPVGRTRTCCVALINQLLSWH